MQRPPDSRRPPILFQLPTYEWINRVNQKHKELVALRPSAEQHERLIRWTEVGFAHATLLVEGVGVSKEEVARVAYGPSRDGSQLSDGEQAIARMLTAVRLLDSFARSSGATAALTPSLLLRLHQALTSASAGLRTGAGEPTRPVKPPAGEHVPVLLETTCQWFAAESFTELNPIEQAAIVLLRLTELQPFEVANAAVALLAATLFTVRVGLPPIIISPDTVPSYRAAVEEGYTANTKPMVELLAETVDRSLGKLIEIVRG
ncbi:MAG TPA: Fic family protein [Blastocatellia bacterium]|nr:Fic family protein [Blastocatellia bacterium]